MRTLIMSALLVSSGLMANPDSLRYPCIKTIIANPRYFLAQNIERAIPRELHDEIREMCFASQSMSNDSFWAKMLKAAMPTPVTIPHAHYYDGNHNNVYFEFNADHTRIKTYKPSSDYEESQGEPTIYDFNGKCCEKFFEFRNEELRNFVPENHPEICTTNFLDAWGIPNSRFGWYQLKAEISSRRQKIVVAYAKGTGRIYDLAPSRYFSEYMEKRAPLAQILLFRALGKAHDEGTKIVLTAEEQKILDGMPPQFEGTKQFLRKFIRQN